jgi:hypothetical protein
MINHKELVNTELQGKCSRGRPCSRWEPLVRKDVLQNYGRRAEMEEKELWKDSKMEQHVVTVTCTKGKHLFSLGRN